MSIGERIRKIRNERNITVKALSELSGVSEKTIYRIETNEVQDPKLSSIEPLIKHLKCSADEILTDINDDDRFGELKSTFIQATQLSIEDQLMLIKLVSRIHFASQIENQISKLITHEKK